MKGYQHQGIYINRPHNRSKLNKTTKKIPRARQQWVLTAANIMTLISLHLVT